MALGTITITPKVEKSDAVLYAEYVSIVGDGAYPTGGSTGFTASYTPVLKQGGREILAVIDLTNGANYLAYNKATDSLQAFVRATGAEVANTTNLSGTTFTVLVLSC